MYNNNVKGVPYWGGGAGGSPKVGQSPTFSYFFHCSPYGRMPEAMWKGNQYFVFVLLDMFQSLLLLMIVFTLLIPAFKDSNLNSSNQSWILLNPRLNWACYITLILFSISPFNKEIEIYILNLYIIKMIFFVFKGMGNSHCSQTRGWGKMRRKKIEPCGLIPPSLLRISPFLLMSDKSCLIYVNMLNYWPVS